jgi:hypothetical protein
MLESRLHFRIHAIRLKMQAELGRDDSSASLPGTPVTTASKRTASGSDVDSGTSLPSTPTVTSDTRRSGLGDFEVMNGGPTAMQ